MAYERGDWQDFMTVSLADGDEQVVMARDHTITCLTEEVAQHHFTPVGHMNATEFLDVPPGYMLCVSVTVTKPPSNLKWTLAYLLSELSRPWNEISREQDGLFHKMNSQSFPAMDFRPFFPPDVLPAD